MVKFGSLEGRLSWLGSCSHSGCSCGVHFRPAARVSAFEFAFFEGAAHVSTLEFAFFVGAAHVSALELRFS